MWGKLSHLLWVMMFVCSGCAYIYDDANVPGRPDEQALALANQNTRSIGLIFQDRSVALDSLPVGAIIPFYPYGNLAIPENWRYCNGDEVDDQLSPLYGQKLPNLNDDRFLMGSTTSFGEQGGSNSHLPDGQHTHVARADRGGQHDHGGATETEQSNGVLKEMEQAGEINVRMVEQGHRHAISADGEHRHSVAVNPSGVHDHGGDNRPKYFGVLYIIKIK
ncbi:hypothetical protein [Kordiimonas sp.]|uniref:hypothetical protein n=1 Tax=Kordiimonas sp. TaxID=1970157 RepID=UPI003A8EA4A0